MKWLIALLIAGFLTLALLDFGVFEHNRIPSANDVSRIGIPKRQFPILDWLPAEHLTATSSVVSSTITIIAVLYGAVWSALRLLPSRWFTLEDGSLSRLPDPRLLRDRVRDQDRSPRLLKLLHVTNARWMFPLALLVHGILLISLPVVLLQPQYAWAWGLSALIPIAFIGCTFNPDRPRRIAMSQAEISDILTPRYLPKPQPQTKSPIERVWDWARAKWRHRADSPAEPPPSAGIE